MDAKASSLGSVTGQASRPVSGTVGGLPVRGDPTGMVGPRTTWASLRIGLARTLGPLAFLACLGTASGNALAEGARTWAKLTTGNGHGFQVYDANTNKIVTFLDHPYRYLGPSSFDPKADGPGRRDLAFDFFFGVKGNGGGWLDTPTGAQQPEYLDQTNIIHAPLTKGAIGADAYYFAPFGYEGNAMVALLKTSGASDAFALFNFHLGNAPDPDNPQYNDERLRPLTNPQALVETGPGGGAMIYMPIGGWDNADCNSVWEKVKNGQDLGTNTACEQADAVPGFQKKVGADGWFGVVIQFVENAASADATASALRDWVGGRSPEKVLSDARGEWDKWRVPPSADVALCSEAEKTLWRQSEAVLRMGQVREPFTDRRKNYGMVLASLPPGEWHSGWVRDAIYGVVALARLGHFAEAKAALNFFLDTDKVGKYASYVNNVDYQISVVRYYGNGEEEADYSGQPTPNIETDGWGLFLWAARQYVELSGDKAWLAETTKRGRRVYDAIVSGVVEPLEKNMEANGIMRADSSIWEVHDANKEHFAYTTMAAMRGLCDMAAMASWQGGAASKYQDEFRRMKTAFFEVFRDQQGAIPGSFESLSSGKYYDGAVAEAFTWNLLDDFKGTTAVATLEMLNRLRVDSGGFKRNNQGKSSYDDNEWILVDLRIANALRRAGKTDEADGYVAQIIEKAAANFNLLPELYNAVAKDGQIGKYTGSIPMVGYGAGAYVITMMDRSGIIEPHDCGDGVKRSLPKVTCGNVITNPSSGGGSGGGGGTSSSSSGGSASAGAGAGAGATGPGGAKIPYEPACLCVQGPMRRGAPWWTLVTPLVLFLRRGVRRRVSRWVGRRS